MAAILKNGAVAPIAYPVYSLDQMAYLNFLRFMSMSCRCKPQTNLFEACAFLHVEPSAERESYAEMMMRCLPEALGKPASLFAPGTQEISFDEKWLIQLGLAAAQKDEASLQFLLSSRVTFQNRRMVRFLISRISEFFALV